MHDQETLAYGMSAMSWCWHTLSTLARKSALLMLLFLGSLGLAAKLMVAYKVQQVFICTCHVLKAQGKKFLLV